MKSIFLLYFGITILCFSGYSQQEFQQEFIYMIYLDGKSELTNQLYAHFWDISQTEGANTNNKLSHLKPVDSIEILHAKLILDNQHIVDQRIKLFTINDCFIFEYKEKRKGNKGETNKGWLIQPLLNKGRTKSKVYGGISTFDLINTTFKNNLANNKKVNIEDYRSELFDLVDVVRVPIINEIFVPNHLTDARVMAIKNVNSEYSLDTLKVIQYKKLYTIDSPSQSRELIPFLNTRGVDRKDVALVQPEKIETQKIKQTIVVQRNGILQTDTVFVRSNFPYKNIYASNEALKIDEKTQIGSSNRNESNSTPSQKVPPENSMNENNKINYMTPVMLSVAVFIMFLIQLF